MSKNKSSIDKLTKATADSEFLSKLKADDIEHLKGESHLPNNYSVISYKDEVLELSESERREFIIIGLDIGEENNCYLVCTKNQINSNMFFSIQNRIRNKQYQILKIYTADNALIRRIYEVRNFEDNQRATATDSVVVGFFEIMLKDALAGSISDVHILCRPTGGIIKMRKHGEMLNWRDPLTSEDAFNLCSVIYNVLAETKQVNFDPKQYQPAAVNYKVGSEEVKLRYQSLPVYPDGFDVVLRVLPIGRDEEFTPLTKLGYTEQQVTTLIDCASRPIGSMIIAGVTGSGKSTTLKNLIMFINAHTAYKLKIYTIEDPPEYKIPNVSQIPVIRPNDGNDSKRASAFEAPITACMRADPDIIMIGEVRDAVTGNLTKKAVQSGHQVLTTVHASSAAGIIDRFLDFDVSRAVLGAPDFLTALIYQKLLPTLCTHCCVDFKKHLNSDAVTPDDIEMAKRLSSIINLNNYPIFIRSTDGCDKCEYMGISGRSVCAEIIKVDLEVMDFITKGEPIALLKHWRSLSDGQLESKNMTGKTCMEHAVQKMLTGIISPFDVESSFKPLSELFIDKENYQSNQETIDELDKLTEKVKNKGSSLWDEINL